MRWALLVGVLAAETITGRAQPDPPVQTQLERQIFAQHAAEAAVAAPREQRSKGNPQEGTPFFGQRDGLCLNLPPAWSREREREEREKKGRETER